MYEANDTDGKQPILRSESEIHSVACAIIAGLQRLARFLGGVAKRNAKLSGSRRLSEPVDRKCVNVMSNEACMAGCSGERRTGSYR